MNSTYRISSGHREFISDTAFDYYGKRLVSASADGYLRIWNEVSGEFQMQTEIKAFSSLISRVDWAHPIFGQIFAACLHNDSAVIYQESIDSSKCKRWIEQCRIVPASPSPLDLSFCPSFFGLFIAICCRDGCVYVYRPTDSYQLKEWICDSSFQVNKEIQCLSWCKSRDQPMSLVIGTEDDAEVWQLGESHQWELKVILAGSNGTIRNVAWSNSLGKDYETIATACSDGCIRIYEIQRGTCTMTACLRDHERDVWRIEWNTTGTILASSGDDNVVRLWKQRFDKSWSCISDVHSDST